MTGALQAYIDRDAERRAAAKLDILSAIDKNRLPPPDGVPDADLYRPIFEGLTIGRLQPWLSKPHGLRTALSPDRVYMLLQLAGIAPPGVAFELGVYTGGITRALLDMNKFDRVVAFDTFCGISGSSSVDLHSDGDYNAGDVSAYIAGAEIVAGRVPETLQGRFDEVSFAHLDMDVYEPTRDALACLWPLMVRDGIIVLDDYGFWSTPGIKRAVDEFPCGQKLYLPTGQMVIFNRGEE